MRVRHISIGHEAGADLSLAAAEAGDGGRPLLLVHGFTGAKEDWADVVDPLAAQGWHVVAPDLRGHGESSAPPGEEAYDLGRFVADIAALTAALGWDRFTLLGHSMGGALAQRFVLDHPERVVALVLMSTFHGPVPVEANLVALGVAVVRQGGMPGLSAALTARREADPVARGARERMEETRPGFGEWADGKLLACSADMWTSMAPRFLAWPDVLPEMSKVAVPTLVVVGADDDTMRADCERLARAIPGARLEVLPGAGHNPHLDTPGRWWTVVSGFLDEVAGRTAADAFDR